MNESWGPRQGPREFSTTQWSLVQAAQVNPDDDSRTRARAALAALCERYWYPLYVFVRSRGHSPPDAQDLTQGFFARLLNSGGFSSADPQRGRFRSWLLGAMKHFLANQWHRDKAEKRGGKVAFLEWDALDPESRYAAEPALASDPDPDAVFDRQWALAAIGRAMEKLQFEAEAAGKSELFQALKPSLSGEERPRSETAARLGMTEAAVKVAVHRLRQRYRDLLRTEVAQTVTEQSDLDDEMRHLVAVLRGP